VREFKIDNDAFESWLRTKCNVVLADLDFKHQRMKTNAFVFLRATYFRWATQIEALCPDLALAPSVLSVGDTHVENFGTWRDGDGRLVWGVNDFDEVASIAYPFDLVRLATSAQLTPKLAVGTRQALDAILSGYLDALAEPRPTIVHEHSIWMRTLVQPSDAACISFWRELDACPDAEPPQGVADALRNSLPPGSTNIRFCSRRKGGGGLGRARFVAAATWQGGTVAREAKAWVPSAWGWARGYETTPRDYLALATGTFRSPDPDLRLDDRIRFIIRRIAPDSRKIDLGDVLEADLDSKLLRVMGFELGAIHAAAPGPRSAIIEDLKRRPSEWLVEATRTAVTAVEADFETWLAGG